MKRFWIGPIAACLLSACGGGGGSDGGGSETVKQEGKRIPLSVYNWVRDTAVPFRTLNASPDDNFDDLAAFGAAVGDARVVSLTEDTHGDANAFELMNRQVQYLHKVKGFDVLLMESAMFDVEAIWRSAMLKNASVADLAPNRIFFMYSKTDTGRKVLRYVDEQRTGKRPLLLGGLDIPLGGATSIDEIVPALTRYLQSRKSPALSNLGWSEFAATAGKAAALTSGGVDHKQFDAVATQLQTELCGDASVGASPRETAGWWCLQVKGLVADVERQDTKLNPFPDPRDRQMAENVMWSLDHLYTGKKVILWSNTQHGTVIRDCTDKSCIPPSRMAAYLRDRLGTQLYVVKNTANKGAISDYGDPKTSYPYASQKGYDTESLDALGKTMAFLNQPTDPVILDALESYPAPVPTLGPAYSINGLFYYPTAVPAMLKDYATVPLP